MTNGDNVQMIPSPVEVNQAKKRKSVLWRVLFLYKWTWLASLVLKFVIIALQMSSPLLLKYVHRTDIKSNLKTTGV